MMLLLPINVFARDRINLTADKMDLEAKDEIVLTAKLDSKTDFYALTATLAYDQNVFEKITKEDFIIDDENIEIVYNDSNAKFGIINKKGAISPVLFKIHLTVKDNPNVGNTNLALTNIEASDGDDKVTYDEATLKVLVTRDAVAGETVPTNSENDIDLENTKTIRTFSTKPIIFVVALIVIALASYAIYLYVTKDENRAKIRNITIIALIFLVILIVLLVINLTKKDINDDGKTNYEDAKDIIKYLIEIEGTKKNDFSYDVNNDGRVDVKDVASNTQHITEEINYKVSLTARNTDELYLEAGTVTLEFDATVTNNEPIKEVKINDKYYPVIKADNFYRVIIDGVTEPGIHEFKISKVRLNNGREVSSELTFKKEILKDKPYVDMFYLSEDNKSLNFLLEDKHEAFIKGTVVILDAAGNKVLEEPIAKDNHLDYPFVLDETYTITIVATYDLDSNTKDDEIGRNNRFENDIIYTHNLMVTGDYKFIISDLTITDALEKEEKPVITYR